MGSKIHIPNGLTIAKRMLFLAWKESSSRGLGSLQDQGEQSEETVFWAAYNRGDGFPYIEADYIFGRMMKLHLQFGDNYITEPAMGDCWRVDHQSFCHKYRNFRELYDAAVASLKDAPWEPQVTERG